jgi:nitroreductase
VAPRPHERHALPEGLRLAACRAARREDHRIGFRPQDATPDAATNTADLFEIMRTTRSMRRLKPDPVPNELIRKILEAGVCAPSGENMQRWRFLVIRDPKTKETVGAYHKRAWDEQAAPRYRAGDPASGMSREQFHPTTRRHDRGRQPARRVHRIYNPYASPSAAGADGGRIMSVSIPIRDSLSRHSERQERDRELPVDAPSKYRPYFGRYRCDRRIAYFLGGTDRSHLHPAATPQNPAFLRSALCLAEPHTSKINYWAAKKPLQEKVSEYHPNK